MRLPGIGSLAEPLGTAATLDPLLHRIGNARVVMLGEASHGTHEYYHWRSLITRRLVAERGFSFLAVEGDWPDCARVDASVRLQPEAPADPRAALMEFERWPTWMWANEEVAVFCRWLRSYNADRSAREQVGFHGLDVYSLWESLRAILMHLREHDPHSVPAALDAYLCFEPHLERAHAHTRPLVPAGCEDEVVALLTQTREHAVKHGSAEFATWQNAEVVASAERYYRAMMRGGGASWNIRDTHMADTLDRLLAHYGPDAKAVVWAHNSHVGDARATNMADAGMVNIGQLARERYGDQVVLVGFGCYRGTVVAATEWGEQAQVITVPAARPGSVEAALHDQVIENALLVFPLTAPPRLLTDTLDHRAIGVVYDPRREHRGNYVPTRLAERYDAFCWFNQTTALHPLHTIRVATDELETFPTGV